MTERRLDRTFVPNEWLRKFNTHRVTQGFGVGDLAARSEVSGTTARRFISGAAQYFKSELVGKMVNALGLPPIDRFELLGEIGFQLPFRGIFNISWDGRFGSVGWFVDQIMIEERLTDRDEQQLFGNMLLPRAVSMARGVHGLGAQIASMLPL